VRLAIPVYDDSLKVFRRTGKTPYFAIFDLYNDEVKFIEIRKNPHSEREEHHHDDEEDFEESVELHRRDLSVIDDCNYIMVSAVGKHLKEALKRKRIGIIRITYKDDVTAYDFIKEFLNRR